MAWERKDISCPYCGRGMRSVVMRCDACEVELRGDFRETLFGRLPAEDLECLEKYLLAGFSIKAMAASSGMGYTAIRGRLDGIIERYARLRDDETRAQRILSRLSSGEITAAEARRLIAASRKDFEDAGKGGR